MYVEPAFASDEAPVRLRYRVSVVVYIRSL